MPGRGEWWRDAVIYQAYPRSFADGDGDGVGDLPGLISRLDHLEWLGVDALWINPVTPSPQADWGYDVSDYCGVDPEYGTLDDLDRLVREAGARGIRVLLDIVPNHTSDRHPWFAEARASRDSARRDWYVWVDPGPGGAPPNNWQSTFGGDAWTLDERTGQLYLHNFLAEQPDLNWWNDDVRAAFDDILRFWFDRGVAGFRIDVAHGLVHDRELRDNPPLEHRESEADERIGQDNVHSMRRPETHDVWRRWRALADACPEPRLLLGETYVMDLDELASYYGDGGGLHLAQNFVFLNAGFDAEELRRVVEATEAALPGGAWPVWQASNHDHVRFPTRWADGDAGLARCGLLILLALRGTPTLYYGDELGMEEVEVPRDRLRDPVGVRFWPKEKGRDGARTPMPWRRGRGHGFTVAGVEPWLPFGAHAGATVDEQRDDPGSTLRFTRDLIALRRELGDLRTGAYASLASPAGAWAWRRGERVVAAVNLGGAPAGIEGVEGIVRIDTRREREGEAVDGTLRLPPRSGAIVAAL